MTDQLDVFLAEHAASRPMPAVALAVVHPTGPAATIIQGTANLVTGEPVTPQHWWDLASLTKVLLTAPAVLDLADTGQLDLDQPISTQWARATGRPAGSATPRQLLSHTGGLPAEAHLWQHLPESRAELVQRLLDIHPVRPPGSAAEYSDVGFLLLGELLADLGGSPLDELARTRGPLRYTTPQGSLPGPAVATEDCPWRGRMIQGEVHDENAWALGGVAGHAGAFATLPALTQITRQILANWKPNNPSYQQQGQTPDGTQRFGLGWWLPPTRGIGGTNPGPRSFGMSGFVGHRIWFEPDNDYAVIILSNRIHPHRNDNAPFKTWCQTLLDETRHRLNQR
jgi:CubicO group peptidase (beta-lactamase class C family)